MPVNVQVLDGNLSLGPQSGFFYSISSALNALIQVEADGSVVNTFPVVGSQFRNPPKQLHFDGTFFWTLEDLPSSLGAVIKQWRLTPFKTFIFPGTVPTEFRWQDELTLVNTPNIRWSASGFAVEHYHRTLDNSFLRGSNVIRLNSVSNIAIGDRLNLGPSNFGGFTGNEEFIIVSSVNKTTRDVSFNKIGGLENSYLSLDSVDFSKSVFLFNDHAFSGGADNKGTLIKFAWPKKNIILTDQSYTYNGVSAADFDQTILCWAKTTQILEVDIAALNFDILTSLEANLVEADQNTPIVAEDLIADLSSNLFYKLQQKETTEIISTGTFSTVNFAPHYNFQTQSTIPIVNSISISFPDSHFVLPFVTGETLRVKAEVRDQYNLPVLGQSVQFSANLNTLSLPGVVGTFNPIIAITNASGIASSIYTPSSTLENLLIDVHGKVL